MRGKPVAGSDIDKNEGITPAHAGKTSSVAYRSAPPQDHPRACGENARDVLKLSSKEGSPPRMRGKPLDSEDLGGVSGITPAHAGKTPFRRKSHTSAGDHPRACGENPSR